MKTENLDPAIKQLIDKAIDYENKMVERALAERMNEEKRLQAERTLWLEKNLVQIPAPLRPYARWGWESQSRWNDFGKIAGSINVVLEIPGLPEIVARFYSDHFVGDNLNKIWEYSVASYEWTDEGEIWARYDLWDSNLNTILALASTKETRQEFEKNQPHSSDADFSIQKAQAERDAAEDLDVELDEAIENILAAEHAVDPVEAQAEAQTAIARLLFIQNALFSDIGDQLVKVAERLEVIANRTGMGV